MKLLLSIYCSTLLVTVMFVSAALGQTVTGAITGEVTDPSGAVISGAQVVAHNLGTGVDTPATTNASGLLPDQFPAHRALHSHSAGARFQ